MLSHNERLLRQTREELYELGKQAEEIHAKQAAENRDRTPEENSQIADLSGKMQNLQKDIAAYEDQIRTDKKILEAVGQRPNDDGASADAPVAPMPTTVGRAFTESDAYKAIQDPAARKGEFTSDAVEMPFQTKGTLLSQTTGSGAGLIPVPQVVGGVVPTLFQRNVFANLLGSGQATTNSIRYIVEGTATSGVTGVAEAGTKPESTLGLSTKDESVKKLATLLPVAEEMLEDASQVEGYINGRLSLFIQNAEDLQLIRGGGTNDLSGIIGRTGVNIYGGGTAAGDKAAQIFKAINGVRGSAFTEPEWVVVNPADYQDLRLLKDANNQYFGGGPWLGEYGVGGQVNSNPQVTGGSELLWGKRVYVTANIGSGTALAGNGMDAIVWRRGGIRIDATNSHSTYFANNLVAIRAEERLALAVYRPGSFVEIRLA